MKGGPDIERYARTCFLIMPYGVRDVGARRVNFDRIYEDIFTPAIGRVRVDGTTLIPRRADDALHSRLLIHTMMQDLLASRVAIAEISTENANVHYELGVRHGLVRSGTVLLRLKGATAIPFDLAPVMVNDYADTPPARAEESVGKIAVVLRQTLKENALDSPAYAAALRLAALMGPPDAPTTLGGAMTEAEEAALRGAPRDAAQLYRKAATLEPTLSLLYERQGALFLQSGDDELAQHAFRQVVALEPDRERASRIADALNGRDLRRVINPLTIVVPRIPAVGTGDRGLDLDRLIRPATPSGGTDFGDLGDGADDSPDGGRFGHGGFGTGGVGGGRFGPGGSDKGGSGQGGSGSGGGFSGL